MTYKYLSLALAVLALILGGCAGLPNTRTVSTASGIYAYAITGQGGLAVVLEAGLGDGMESWAKVFPEIGKFSQVFAYNRAGYGPSQSARRPRDARTVVAELRELLKAARIPPPYVLVGHSLGGTYMEFFARNYPGEVAGVVLVDARSAEFGKKCAEAGAWVCEPPGVLAALYDELEASALTMQQVAGSPAFPPVPLAVLTGMNKPVEGAAFRQAWLESQQELARLSVNARHIVCETCGHYVHHDAPAQVVEAIAWTIRQAGGR